ncbi:tRNA (adenosine(37)-N6)-threonylcarbamoyltransferase complex ATPase subunit type 1 TsaE [Streptococcus pseudoporcinus]|uniref:tRNA threonylcarbamoyladenosine biosynthesis protein TsaE n=1 Tax=Streptococcus pseudoporcinus TaxID=361101 RepID=A0A4U9Y5S7_9STRE|nr:tRNA (adenosine(37)-N6)-threonylcarbamoyltransferase complex ATPase subunit type 1 TsaE [Streptococcus pseudoporcinus]VTS21444.1 ATP/GTP binding protein-P-loop hydrolase [Streptococcus pseudoporcinus]VUC69962.1 ATP/GTP binding protein-P-loop hydrolase [Streptococcus pseudoporcinus]VUD00115.1 ATP/GTP binding protein-P-loop hydrolase [Streptococcus pseudoporcinus]VUD00507.1 ATP/GTP binding protein-P-loop hydrolase [Streptococcus pseudoporcinus]
MFYSKDEAELITFGRALGQKLEENDLLILSGDLGAGKTTLTKGIAQGLGVAQMIKSPTYTIVREYEGRLPLFHLDVYRIGDDPDSIDLDDFVYCNGVTVIEWGDLLNLADFEDYLVITIEKIASGRQLKLHAQGRRSQQLLEELQNG